MRRDIYQAIADPTRREILGMLAFEAKNVNDISGQFKMSRTAVSKHMRILEECGVLTIEKRGRERFCRAQLEALAEVAGWISQYAQFWNSRLDRLEQLLRSEDNDTK